MADERSIRVGKDKLAQKSQKVSSANRSKKKITFNKFTNVKFLIIVAFVIIFGAIGTITLLKSSAYTGNAWWYMPRVAACESGGLVFGTKNYTIVNKYGYAGAYQFGYKTWQGASRYIPKGSAHHQYDYTRPQHAPAAEQDYRFQVLWNHGGSGPWTASQSCWKSNGTLRKAPNQTPGVCAGVYARCSNLPDTNWNGTTTPTTPTTPSSSSLYVETGLATYNCVGIPHTTVRRYSTGDCVKHLQYILKYKYKYDLGNYGPNGDGVDGSFGLSTQNAVIAFQKSRGLSQDGVVGPLTWDALH